MHAALDRTDHASHAQDMEALDWMIDIARGLDYLHSLPVPTVHRVSHWIGLWSGVTRLDTCGC